MSDEASSDAALLAGASRGDGAAFGVLVRRYIRAATLLAAQLLGDADEAEDVVQDAFTVVHGNAGSFDASRPFGPWLFGIVRRLASNRRVREARRRRLLRLWGTKSDSPSTGRRGDEAIVARIDAEAAARAFARLPPMQRACFELRHDQRVGSSASIIGRILAESSTQHRAGAEDMLSYRRFGNAVHRRDLPRR